IDAKPAILAWPLSLFSGFIYIVIRPVFYNIFHLLYPFTHMINFQFPEPFMKNSRLYYFSILSFSNQNLKISNKNATPSEVASLAVCFQRFTGRYIRRRPAVCCRCELIFCKKYDCMGNLFRLPEPADRMFADEIVVIVAKGFLTDHA